MKLINVRRTILCLSVLAVQWGGAVVTAQVRLSVSSGSRIQITGRSNKSDWQVHSTDLAGWIELGDAKDPVSVSAISLKLASKSIKSDQGLIMNRVMYGSLDVDAHPEISFELLSVRPAEVVSDSVNMVAKGFLTLTGSRRQIEVELFAEPVDPSGQLKYVGSFPLRMTDYGMKPPTAMFGQLRVHKDVRVSLDLVFK